MSTTFGHTGDRIEAHEDMEVLPVGSVIGQVDRVSGREFRKIGDDLWEDTRSGYQYRNQQFGLNQHVVRSTPEGWNPEPRRAPTVEQVMWKYRDGALAAAVDHGVGMNSVERALSEMGAGRDKFPFGAGLRVRNTHDWGQMPAGTVVFKGDPDEPRRFGVWVKDNAGSWRQIVGEVSGMGVPVVIDSVNGDRTPPAWLTREATDGDPLAIKQFKARAWRVGYKLKRSNGWCSTYEAIAATLGVTAESLNEVDFEGIHVGDEVDPEQARMMPRGTVFSWQHPNRPEAWAYYLRMRNVNNRSGTHRVAGVNEAGRLGHFKDRMRVAFIGAEGSREYDFNIPSNRLEFFPPGTRFHYDASVEPMAICSDGTITNRHEGDTIFDHGQWTHANFRSSRITVIGLPMNPHQDNTAEEIF